MGTHNDQLAHIDPDLNIYSCNIENNVKTMIHLRNLKQNV